MKLRTGFVSNSSASSFCAFGVGVPRDLESLKDLGLIFTEEDEERIEDEGTGEIVYGLASELDLACHYDCYDDYVYVGLPYSEMKDDETKAQFEARAKETVKKMFPKISPEDCSWIEEAWSQ